MAPVSLTSSKPADAPDTSDLPQTLLNLLAERGSVDSLTVAAELHEDHQKVVGAVNSLLSLPDVVESEQVSSKRLELTAEGSDIADNGSHEAKVYNAIPSDGILQAELMKVVPNAKIGFSKAMLNNWIELDKKAEGGPRVLRKFDSIEDTVKEQLICVRNGKADALNDAQKADFKKRKLLAEVTVKSFVLKKGAAFTTSLSKPETDLTADMLANGSWREKQFKAYNFEAIGVLPASGHLHPLMKVRSEFRQIFFEMGFTEMPTNRYVESSFWNFDTLFQPQQHPARDAHDTFFISDPAESHQFPMDYLERVRKVHAEGGYGSQGYLYDWKLSEAKKNVMRTHTTAVSARQLYKLAQEGFKPSKMFSIDRVFRNETLDATHLAEFHQVEGVVAERGLSLAHVMGLFTEFFKKCGIEKLRFKPTYNPYTEPSMEVFAYHEGLAKWVEIGNSGMFRPEMLLPMGLPEDVNVAGFGLSLERPTMIRYGIKNIRDLFGASVNLRMVYKNPICRLDKQ